MTPGDKGPYQQGPERAALTKSEVIGVRVTPAEAAHIRAVAAAHKTSPGALLSSCFSLVMAVEATQEASQWA